MLFIRRSVFRVVAGFTPVGGSGSDGAAGAPAVGSGGAHRGVFYASGAPVEVPRPGAFNASGTPVGAPMAFNATPAPSGPYFYPSYAGPGIRYDGRMNASDQAYSTMLPHGHHSCPPGVSGSYAPHFNPPDSRVRNPTPNQHG